MRQLVRGIAVFALVIGMCVPATASGAGGAVPDAVPVEVLRSLEALGADPAVIGAAEADDLERDWSYLRPVHDLDGDGLADVISVASTGPAPGEEGELVLTGRRGYDGTILWTHRRPLTGFSTLVPAHVGPTGANGLLLVSYDFTLAGGVLGQVYGENPNGFSNMSYDVELELVSLAGTGEEVWSERFGGGSWAYGPNGARLADNVVVTAGTLDGAGPATDILLGTYDRGPSGQTLRTTVIGGTDGAEVSATTIDITDATTQLVTLPDLSRAGSDAYGVVVHVDESTTSTFTAFTADSAELWSTTLPFTEPFATGVVPLGDATGDDITELVVQSDPAWGTPAAATRDIVVLDGANGSRLLTVEGDRAYPVGDVSGDGRADVAAYTTYADELEAGAEYTVHDVAGGLVHERRHAVETDGRIASVHIASAGDLDGDGVPDLAQQIELRDSSGRVVAVDERAISLRDGAALRRGPLGGRPSGGTFSGSGEDLVSSVPWGGSVREVTAVHGRSGHELWTTRLRTRGTDGTTDSWAVADLDGDGRDDLIGNIRWTDVEYDASFVALFPESSTDGFVVSGRDGTVLWATDPAELPDPPDTVGVATLDEAFVWEGRGDAGIYPVTDVRRCSTEDPAFRCEHILVELANPPADGEPSRTATAVVTLDSFAVPAPATDFDLYVYDSDEHGTKGRLLGSSGEWFDPADERVEFPVVTTSEAASRYVLVEAAYYNNLAGSTYRGQVGLLTP